MDDGELEGGVALLLADRRQHADAPVAKLDGRRAHAALAVADLDPVHALNRDLRARPEGC